LAGVPPNYGIQLPALRAATDAGSVRTHDHAETPTNGTVDQPVRLIVEEIKRLNSSLGVAMVAVGRALASPRAAATADMPVVRPPSRR
jgi:hypothetical protein